MEEVVVVTGTVAWVCLYLVLEGSSTSLHPLHHHHLHQEYFQCGRGFRERRLAWLGSPAPMTAEPSLSHPRRTRGTVSLAAGGVNLLVPSVKYRDRTWTWAVNLKVQPSETPDEGVFT